MNFCKFKQRSKSTNFISNIPIMALYGPLFSRARRCSENLFGILAQKFRIYNKRIQSRPENVDNVILATCKLHNFIKKYENTSMAYHNQQNETLLTNTTTLEAIPKQGGNASQEAFAVRDLFKKFF